MAIWYNAPNSAKNKSADFAKLNVADAKKITFDEATVKVTDDKMTVFAFVTDIEGELKNLDDPKFVFTPQLCMFELLVKGYEWQGKKTEPTVGMKIAIHAINQMEGKPFKGWLDLSKGEWDREIIIDGKTSGEAVTPDLVGMVSKGAFRLEACELDKLTGVTLPEGQSYGKKGGYGGQKEADKLGDRLTFIEEQLKEGSRLRAICEVTKDPVEPVVAQLVAALFN